MDLKLAAVLTITALAVSLVTSNPVPPGSPAVSPSGPKYVPVFVSSDALNRLNEKDGQGPAQPQPESEKSNNDYVNKETQNVIYGPPAPVYEHQPDQHEPSYSPPLVPQNYQNNQPPVQQQYQNMQAPIPQVYPNQQPIQQQSYQPYVTQQPNQMQQYQISQPQSQPLYAINQQSQQSQPIAVAQQPIYSNQQQILQPLGQGLNQQPLLNQQQLVAQPIQTYQQPNLLITQPNQLTMLTQSTQPLLISQQSQIPNQQILFQQSNPNGQMQAQIPNQQAIILQPNQQMGTSNVNPILQPNPGYIQNQNQNVYAVVPINGQNLGSNQNVGSNTYLVPVQQVPNQSFVVNSG